MALTDQEIAQVAAAVLAAMASAAQAEEEAATPAPTPLDVELARLEAAAVAEAEAEKARWDAMPADELAEHETAAARQRYTDAIVDVLQRDGDPGVVAELAEPLAPDVASACRSEAHARLADNPAAQARIEQGLKSRRTELEELLAVLGTGKASPEQRGRLAALLVG